jgi:beta-lactamase regulating signal transducer with metallopeptidase domain
VNNTWLLETAMRTLCMGAIIWLTLHLLRVEQIRAQRTAWLLALGAALLMPLLVATHIGPRIIPEFSKPASTEFSAESGMAAAMVYELHAAASDVETPMTVRVHALKTPAAIKVTVARVILGVYVTAASVLVLRLALGLTIALRLKWRARRIEVGALADADVRVSEQLANPVTITSSILLPRNYLQWDASTLRIVLSHEFAHVRQRDFYVQLLAGVHCALFWFNPFSWWLQRQLADLGEALSDHAASQQAESRASYAELLLSFASSAQLPQAAVAMARSSNLTPRIERLLNDRGFERCFSGRTRLHWVAGGIVILAFLASTATKSVGAAEITVTPPLPEAPQAPELSSPPESAPADVAPPPVKPETPKRPARPVPPLIARVASLGPVPTVAPVPPMAPMPEVAPVPVVAPLPPMPAPPPVRRLSSLSNPLGTVAPDGPPPVFARDDGGHETGTWVDINDNGVSYMQVENDEVFVFKSGDAQFMINGDFKKRFGTGAPLPQGDFIFYQHQGKPYLIQDPSILKTAKDLFAPLKDTYQHSEDRARLRALKAMQQVDRDSAVDATVSIPDVQASLDEIYKMLDQMKNEKLSLNKDQKRLVAMVDRLGNLQAKLGQMQAQLAMQSANRDMAAAESARQQAEIREDIDRHHEQTNLGIIKHAQSQLAPLINQAIKDGKAKRVD